MVLWIQVIGMLFALDMIFITYFYHKREIFKPQETIIWMTIWLGLLFAVMFPSTLEIVIRPLKVVRVMDFLVIVAFFLSFSLLFIVFIKTKYNEKRLEKVIRELAMQQAEEKK
jgi:hypothetical protein